jgi:transposase
MITDEYFCFRCYRRSKRTDKTSLHTWQWRLLRVCVCFCIPKIMGRKGKEMSPDLKKVAVDLFRNGEKISDIARVLQQPRSTISDIRIFREAGTVKNRPRSGRPPAINDRDYRVRASSYFLDVSLPHTPWSNELYVRARCPPPFNSPYTMPIVFVYCQTWSQPSFIRIFREAGTVKNRPRSGRPPAINDRDYRQLEKIVKTERTAPLVEITAKLNEERNVSVSKRTVRWRWARCPPPFNSPYTMPIVFVYCQTWSQPSFCTLSWKIHDPLNVALPSI